jgi:outer membrane protein OmpA-like peptidoglycan-associated protein
MAYIRIGENESTLGSFGCGLGCRCSGCRKTAVMSSLGERYVPEEEETTPPPAPTPAPAAPPRSNLSGWSRFGEPLPQRRLSPTGGLQLRMPAFATLTGFARGGSSLNAAQLEHVKRVAEFIAQSWRGTSPIMSIRITGYIDANESQSGLGQRRAAAVRDALLRVLGPARPGLAKRLRWIMEDRGFSPVAKVEIYLWHGPTPPPVPPLVRVPSPAEAARRDTPIRTETPEEQIQRTLTTPLPTPPPRRSFSQMFWNKVDGNLNAIMNRLRVPKSLHDRIRDAAHAALERGTESLLNKALDQTGLGTEAKEAIRASVRAAAKTPSGRDAGSQPLGAWDLAQPSPATPVFRFECPAGCAPLAADDCRKVLLQAIHDAIHLASNSASKLEANPRDAKTVSIFLKLFGHDPSRPVPWAENRESGAIVAWRLRKVAQELGGGRRTLYRCGCPGAAPTVNARTVSPLEVRLCSRFWRLGQPGVLPAGQNPRWIRAGIILHEMLHQLFREFFRHFRVPPRPDDPQERRRDNAHCYEAFALLVDGHTPAQSDLNRCAARPA